MKNDDDDDYISEKPGNSAEPLSSKAEFGIVGISSVVWGTAATGCQ